MSAGKWHAEFAFEGWIEFCCRECHKKCITVRFGTVKHMVCDGGEDSDSE